MLVNQGVETPVPEKVRKGGRVEHMMIFIKEEIIECRGGS